MRQGVGAAEPAQAAQRPLLIHSLFELRFPLEAALFWIHGIHHPWPRVEESNRKTVMMIPGFMAGDLTLTPLAVFCRWLGHRTSFTGIRSNSKCPRETLMHLESHLERVHAASQRRVVIVGQSLGGVYARELAARRPDLVERVVTLGSPIRAVEDSSNPLVVAAARMIAILRGMKDGCLTSACRCGMALVERPAGEVPTTVVYSRTDGVVHWQSCIDRSGNAAVENVEVMASHVGMGLNADVYRVLAERLAAAPRASMQHRVAVADRTRRPLRLIHRREVPQLT
jgi:triacylglycerol lipase